MPQIFQALRCYKCSVFQVHQTKKSNKWQCKLCGEKQSLKRHYGLGTAKDCRLHVQKLNGIRGEIDELAENTQSDTDAEVEYNEPSTVVLEKPPKKSKWSDYVDTAENTENTTEDAVMYLGDAEVVLEVNKRKRKFNSKSFKVPKKKINSEEEISEVQRDSNGCKEILQKLNEISNIPKQDNYIQENYYTTPNNYTGSVLEMPVTNEDSLKIRTNMSLDFHKPKLHTQESQTRVAFTVPKQNSRWAQYVDTEENGNEENNEIFKDNDPFVSNKDPQSFFSLCDDKDLDDVLDV